MKQLMHDQGGVEVANLDQHAETARTAMNMPEFEDAMKGMLHADIIGSARSIQPSSRDSERASTAN